MNRLGRIKTEEGEERPVCRKGHSQPFEPVETKVKKTVRSSEEESLFSSKQRSQPRSCQSDDQNSWTEVCSHAACTLFARLDFFWTSVSSKTSKRNSFHGKMYGSNSKALCFAELNERAYKVGRTGGTNVYLYKKITKKSRGNICHNFCIFLAQAGNFLSHPRKIFVII